MQILSFEVNAKCVPLAMKTVVMEVLCLIRIFSLWLRHRHAHYTRANWALEKALTFIFLRLGFGVGQDIVADLTVKIFNFFLEAESTERFLAFSASVHFL